ncbi:DUF4064 domain-containing protein [Sporosarcina sp. ACRSL]|uniref:DUF4064 domain-containing protein n=1 Tax=Sporosarcina sp. ACRSL TaxID=2918215 RepID=UPI001EF66A91|nr:DUF4064 domain-containing protein [Sporosarcina sp. ACRSL]MCG7346359.1 DUF4064 domain-containing protein [Sporosarcina sp. ACRSL]
MNRTAEKVLSIIAVVLTAIGTVFGFIGLAIFNLMKNDPMFKAEFEAEMMADPTLTQADVEMFYTVFNVFGGFLWLIIIGMIISIVLNIVGIVNIWKNKNAKLAGIMFIIAGVLGGILSLSSILLYVAAILCFTKKPPLQDDMLYANQSHEDSTMRPL